MLSDLSLGNGGKKDMLLYPRTENVLPGRQLEDNTPCCSLGLRFPSLGMKKGAVRNAVVYSMDCPYKNGNRENRDFPRQRIV